MIFNEITKNWPGKDTDAEIGYYFSVVIHCRCSTTTSDLGTGSLFYKVNKMYDSNFFALQTLLLIYVNMFYVQNCVLSAFIKRM